MSEEVKLPAILVVALLAGSGGSVGMNLINNPRPDPFTGSMGKRLEADLRAEAARDHASMRTEWKTEADRIYKALQRIETRMDLQFDRLHEQLREHDK